MMKKFYSIFGIALLGALVGYGCGTDSGPDVDGTGGSGDGDGDGDGTGGSGEGTGGSGEGSGSGGADDGGGGAAGGPGDDGSGTSAGWTPSEIPYTYDPTLDVEPETCSATEITAEEIFLDMFVILDKSGSMTIGAPDDSDDMISGSNDPDGYCDIGDPNNGSRWCNSINSLYGFFSSADSLGMGVAWGEFHDGSCDAFDMEEPFGILEANGAHLARIQAAMNDDNPRSGTNTEGAVDTLIAQTGAHMPTGTRKTVAILVTDGDPSRTCRRTNNDPSESVVQDIEEHLTELNGLLTNHFTSNDVPTFIIGMDGVDYDRLETLAAGAGATPHTSCLASDPNPTCSYYSVGDGDPTVFERALDDIRSSVLGCEYVVPRDQVEASNLDTLEVKFTPSTSDAEITLDQVDSESSCSSATEYWVDFSGVDPIVKLCPATCDTRGEGASVDISLQCKGK